MLAVFKIFYGYHDKDYNDSPYVAIVASIAYPGNLYIRELIIFNWRGDNRGIEQEIAEVTSTISRNARYKIEAGESKFNTYRDQFHKTANQLARDIGAILGKYDILK